MIRKVILSILFCFNLACSAQNKESRPDTLGVFYIEKLESNFFRLRKTSFTLKLHDAIIAEKPYSLEIPPYKSIKSSISQIPNQVKIDFSKGEKIFIVGNKGNYKSTELMVMSKDSFIKKIQELNLNITELDKVFFDFDEKKYFGIKIYNDYIIIYINIRKKDLKKFNFSLESFKLLENINSSD